MFELLSAVKLNAVLSEGVKSIVATGSKEVIGRAVKEKGEGKSSAGQVNPFGENGAVSDALIPLALNGTETQALTSFLNSDLFASLLKSSLAIAVTGAESDRRKFSELLVRYISVALPGKTPVVLAHFCDQLSELIVDRSEQAWSQAAELGLVDQIEAVTTSTQSLVSAEIASIGAQLADFVQVSIGKLREYELFEKRYRKAVGDLHGKLKPATLHDAKETPIDSIYVASHLRAQAPRSPQHDVIDRATLLKASFRTVILGTPGGGKSTFASKLCYDLHVRYGEHLYGGRALTPVFLVLKDYAKYRKDHPCSIAEFATLRCKADLQIEPPDGVFRYLFMVGRSLVIFDGLDELLETSDRVSIKQAVENFAGQYPVVPILVTSREVGYEQAPLDKDKFEVYRLESFNEDQVTEYVLKWFDINKTPGKAREAMARAFMRDSAAVPDLRQNPLMLSLLCSLYKQDGYLPSNRPAVYKRCADLLFETWDKGRDIVVNLPLDRKLRPAMAHLAHWIYSDSTLQGGVKESTLVSQTAAYLSSWCADIDEAQGTAEKFISFFRGRAWVFSDTGSSKSEPLYQFTHRTFLEFFTAEHLVKSYGNVRELTRYLLPRLLEREWDVVCQLIYQMCSEMRSASDELVGYLIQDASHQDLIGRLRLASFLSRSLDFIFPTRLKRIEAIDFCIQALIDSIHKSGEEPDGQGLERELSEEERLGGEILQALVSCSAEMLELQASTLADRMVGFVNGTANAVDRANMLLCIELFETAQSSADGDRPNEYKTAWAETKAAISRATMPARSELAHISAELALSAWWDGKLDVSDLLQMHGVVSVFMALRSPLQGWFRVPIADFAVSESVQQRAELNPRVHQQGKKLPTLMLSFPFPWFDREADPSIPWGWLDRSAKWPEDTQIRELALLMLVAGAMGSLPTISQFGKEASLIARAREDGSQRQTAKEILKGLNVGEEVTAFVSRWIDGGVENQIWA